ncbi:MAG: rhodanese-like domain-containing protein [bacterium]|nr:rhodanese-like domain-containing protein [bacterium]
MNSERKNNRALIIGATLIAMVLAYTLFKDDFKKTPQSGTATKETNSYPKITAQELKNKLSNNKNNVQIVDTRSLDDYTAEHIIGSISAASQESLNAVSPEKTTAIIGYSSEDANISGILNFLKSKKVNDLFILTGGFSAWKSIGGSTISAGDPNSFTDQSKVAYITPEDLKKILDDKTYSIYVLDIRSKQLFDAGHILGAGNIFIEDLEKSKDNLPLGKELIVYGDTEIQGFQAGVKLYDLNFFAARVLSGGLTSWKEKEFEIVK